jgi:hypothetical protein
MTANSTTAGRTKGRAWGAPPITKNPPVMNERTRKVSVTKNPIHPSHGRSKATRISTALQNIPCPSSNGKRASQRQAKVKEIIHHHDEENRLNVIKSSKISKAVMPLALGSKINTDKVARSAESIATARIEKASKPQTGILLAKKNQVQATTREKPSVKVSTASQPISIMTRKGQQPGVRPLPIQPSQNYTCSQRALPTLPIEPSLLESSKSPPPPPPSIADESEPRNMMAKTEISPLKKFMLTLECVNASIPLPRYLDSSPFPSFLRSILE